MPNLHLFEPVKKIAGSFSLGADLVLYQGDVNDFMATISDKSVSLIITSPPYNLGKDYEDRVSIEKYLEAQSEVIAQFNRILKDDGSICWQVGNFVEDGEVYPLDILYYNIFKRLNFFLRNRIIWHFGHGLHASKRFSGRYETILWFTKSSEYVFNLDSVRVPSKYPGKRHYKGPNYGKPSGNPLGKNPGDVWAFRNVKHNHEEQTIHPSQFPEDLIERVMLATTEPGDIALLNDDVQYHHCRHDHALQ